jgi:hypothetical protein
MHWIHDVDSNKRFSNYSLVSSDRKIAEVRINHLNRTVRISMITNRLFLFEHSGLFQQKIQFKSEYGFPEGVYSTGKDMYTGQVQIGDKIYLFTTEDNKLVFINASGSRRTLCDNVPGNDQQLSAPLIFAFVWMLDGGLLDEFLISETSMVHHNS